MAELNYNTPIREIVSQGTDFLMQDTITKSIADFAEVIEKNVSDRVIQAVSSDVKHLLCEKHSYLSLSQFQDVLIVARRNMEFGRYDKLYSIIKEVLLNHQEKSRNEAKNSMYDKDNLVKKGEKVFNDHVLLFLKSKVCFMDLPSKIGPLFDKEAFDAYLDSVVGESSFEEFYMNSFDEKNFRVRIEKRISQEKKKLFSPSQVKGNVNTRNYMRNYDTKKSEQSFNQYCLNIVAVYQYLSSQGVKFLSPE